MKIIYLILAEGYANQLSKLVESLNSSHSFFVVHVSKSQLLQPFTSFLNPDERTNVHFIKKRYVTEKGGYNLIQATLNGLKYIYNNFSPNSRVVVLHGQDYPIKPREYIYSYFKARPNNIYIQYSSIETDNSNRDNEGHDNKQNKLSVKLYGGDFGMSFSVKTINIMFNFLKDNPDFLAYFKNVASSNEKFFQTLLLNCETRDTTYNISNQNLRFVRWNKTHLLPTILNGQDIELIKGDDSLFATKFDPELSYDLLIYLDHSILKIEKNSLHNQALVKNVPDGPITKQSAILYLTDKWNKGISENFNDLMKVSSINRDVLLIYHNSGKMPRSIKKLNPFVFDDSILYRLGYKAISTKLVPGSNHFPLLKFYLENPHYSYYWNIEDDVQYNGKWEDFFDFFPQSNITSDFLSCNINDYKDQSVWYWWNTMGHPFKQISKHSKVRSFNPIFRISNRALKFLNQELSEWSGHHEVLIPTLLKNAGFSINDIGGTGKYSLPECENKFYIPSIDEFLDTGTVRFRPYIRKEEMDKKLLYHPVKFQNKSIFAMMTQRFSNLKSIITWKFK